MLKKCYGRKGNQELNSFQINSDNVEMTIISTAEKQYRAKTQDEIREIIEKV